MRRTALAAALVTMLAGIAPAAAEVVVESRAEAERLAVRAKARFDAHDYDAAIAGYGAAYRRHPSPGLLFNLAQAHRLRGNCAAASLLYHEYLRAAPDSPYRDLTERHLDALAACSQTQTLGAGSGAGGKGGGVSLLRGDDPNPGRGKRTAGIAVGVAGAAMAATGVYLLSQESDDGEPAGDAGNGPGPGDDDDAPPIVLRESTRRSELVGAGLVGAGAASVITGTTLYLLGRRDARERRTTFAVTPSRGGLTAQVGWRF